MIIMLFQLRHVNIGSDDSKDDFNVDKDRSGQLKKLENADCKHYWRKFSIIHFRTCQRIKYRTTVTKLYMLRERFTKKENEFHINYRKMLLRTD